MPTVSTRYRDDIDEVESVEADVEHSLPTPEAQIMTAAIENGQGTRSAGGSGMDKRKKGMVFAGVGIVVCLVLIIVLSVTLAGGGGGGGGGSVSSATSSSQKQKAVVDYLSGFGGVFGDRTKLETTGTPQNLAASWMAVDAFVDVPTTDNVEEAFPFIKRYALAVFYFSLAGPSWNDQYSFLQHTDACESWQKSFTAGGDSTLTCGVGCDAAGHVTEIYLPANNLKGSLPTELQLLPYLTHLSLYYNAITGTLPSNIASLVDLKFLSLEENFLTGTVPSWFGEMNKLEFLNLGYNRFSGALPSEMSKMASLKEISLEWNQITANLHGAFNGITTLESVFLERNLFHESLSSDSLRGADNLYHLDLSDNRFFGSLPPHLFNLYLLDVRNNTFSGRLNFEKAGDGDKMVYLAANDNMLTGPIPTEIGAMTDLLHLDLSRNGFTGPVPTELSNLINMEYLFLGNNPELAISTMPDVSKMTTLTALSFKNNGITGAIPTYLGSLSQLVVLDLSRNQFNGTIPTELAALSKLGLLSTFDNQLQGTADASKLCNNKATTANRTMLLDCTYTCSCCTVCCEASNCTNVEQNNVFKYLAIGYPKVQQVFSEDVKPQ